MNREAGTDLSAVVAVRHEGAEMLSRCFKALGDLRLIVLGMDLDEAQRAAATAAGAAVIDVPPVPLVEAVRDVGLAAATTPWVIFVDPDEVLPAKLVPALQSYLGGNHSGYRLPYDTLAFGRHLTHGFEHGTKLSLMRRERARFGTDPAPHVEPKIDGTVGNLRGLVPAIDHHVYASVDQALEKAVRYGRHQAGQDPVDALQVFRGPFRKIVLTQAWRDGMPGTATATIQLIGEYYAGLKTWELAGYPDIPVRARERIALVLLRLARRLLPQ